MLFAVINRNNRKQLSPSRAMTLFPCLRVACKRAHTHVRRCLAVQQSCPFARLSPFGLRGDMAFAALVEDYAAKYPVDELEAVSRLT